MERAKQAYLQGMDTIEEYKRNKETLTKELIQVKNAPSTQKTALKNKASTITQILESKTDTNINTNTEVSIKLKNTAWLFCHA